MRFVLPLILIFSNIVLAQFDRVPDLKSEFNVRGNSTIVIDNKFGRVFVRTVPKNGDLTDKATVSVFSSKPLNEKDLQISQYNVTVLPSDRTARVDLIVAVPSRSHVKIETNAGAIEVSGDLSSINARSVTGTIALDIPKDDIKYTFQWTESRPRVVSDFDLTPIRERSAGRFEIKGTHKLVGGNSENSSIRVDLSTARGIILINVPPNEVAADLRERPLTTAAKAIIRSGDSLLTEAIRRASPKHFGDYAKTLPPVVMQPRLRRTKLNTNVQTGSDRVVSILITDEKGRAVEGFEIKDLNVTVDGKPAEIRQITQSTAPFNLILLADVSGSVENYVNFIRRAARSFIETVDLKDRVALIIFNDDVQVLSNFSTDRQRLSASLDTFDAGGGTALYDALAYVLADTLRHLNGERSAIVVLSDGDDNSSFLAFDSLIGSIQESGSLIYPMYVPSGLIAASIAETDVDPLRKRYMSLSVKSENEGQRMATISGGIFYKIGSMADIQKAYDDIVNQLRTSYDLTIKYDEGTRIVGAPNRVRVTSKKPNTFVTIL